MKSRPGDKRIAVIQTKSNSIDSPDLERMSNYIENFHLGICKPMKYKVYSILQKIYLNIILCTKMFFKKGMQE